MPRAAAAAALLVRPFRSDRELRRSRSPRSPPRPAVDSVGREVTLAVGADTVIRMSRKYSPHVEEVIKKDRLAARLDAMNLSTCLVVMNLVAEKVSDLLVRTEYRHCCCEPDDHSGWTRLDSDMGVISSEAVSNPDMGAAGKVAESYGAHASWVPAGSSRGWPSFVDDEQHAELIEEVKTLFVFSPSRTEHLD